MILEYLTNTGHLQIKIGNHRHCLSRAFRVEGILYPSSDISNEYPLVQEVWEAMRAAPLSDTPRKLVFNSDFPEKLDASTLFADAILAYDNGHFAEIAALAVLEDEEDTPETITKTRKETKIVLVDGVPVQKEVDVPYEEPVVDRVQVVDEAGNDVMEMSGGMPTGQPLMHPVPRIKRGKKVPTRDKARLAELRTKDIADREAKPTIAASKPKRRRV